MNKITSNGAWEICERIETVLGKKLIDLQARFADLDSSNRGLISETKFLIVVFNQLGHEFGISRQEAQELVDYFKQEDGRINYKDFLQLVLPEKPGQKPIVTGLEWEDHDQVNVLSPFELRLLNLILTKIAYSCRLRGVFLEPYFKDYEQISGNNGTVTIAQFRRILNFVGITLGAKEFQVVLNRFIKNGYSVNYVAFIQTIQCIWNWFDEHGFLDCEQTFVEYYPGKVIIADVDQLPRPDIGKVDIAHTFGTNKAYHPCVEQKIKKYGTKFHILMLRVKKHLYDNGIRSREFFEKFDNFNSGYIQKSQFHRGLDAIGLSGLHRLYVSPLDLEKICEAYMSKCDPDRIAWGEFCDDIDEVFTIKNLDKQPYTIVESPPDWVKQLPRPGTASWDTVPKSTTQLAQDTLFRLRNIIKSQRIFIESFFKGYDKSNHFHVSRCQMRRVFSANSILMSEREVEALMTRYGDHMGFNYWKFLMEINENQLCEWKHKEIMKIVKQMQEKKAPCDEPLSIIEVLAKVKNLITRNRINLEQFLRKGGKLNEGMVPTSKFRASFSAAGIILNDCELDILCKSCYFGSPRFVNHKSFCELMNLAFYRTKLEKQPRTLPIQFVPTSDNSSNFLNFEQRSIVSQALQKLSRHHEDVSNMKSFFDDRASAGIVSKECLERVLTACGSLMELITRNELEVLFKCFSLPDGIGSKFDYVNFLLVLSRINSL